MSTEITGKAAEAVLGAPPRVERRNGDRPRHATWLERQRLRRSARQSEEIRGPEASLLRDALFRRMLMVADVVAIVGAFLLMTQVSSRSIQLTWVGIPGVPILLLSAKVLACMTATKRSCARRPSTRSRSSSSWRPSVRSSHGSRAR